MKKVVIVIVEGPSDEAALGGILKEYFSSDEVQFKIVHGDITSNVRTKVDNIVKRIDEIVAEIRSKYGYKLTDIASIIHLADTDGVFAKGSIREATVDRVKYYEDHMESADVVKTERRNAHKSEILFKLYSTGKVHGIHYRIYYNSCNLEHVLYNELRDFTDEEKDYLSDEFADKFDGKVDKFIEFISCDSIAVPGNYKETWNYIENGNNSLQRHSNMHLIFAKK